MASKSNKPSDPSRKVRIIGKIRGYTDKEVETLDQNSKPWVNVKKPQAGESTEKCRIFPETQSNSRKDGYELDGFYAQDEEVGNIYEREIKPLILEVLNGRNASVIALGARGSGKTYMIQGSQEKPGLATMAMSEILTKSGDLGKSITVSLYEVRQDHAYDLLNPKHPEVHVLEDSQGQINLRGLSQVPMKSISEFHEIYLSESSSQSVQKTQKDQPRYHKGVIVHIISEDEKLRSTIVNKMHFVDLAGYEDPKKSSRDGITPAEINRMHKSLYGLFNVVNAINSNENRVPYRESKLTRILQDSLGGTHCDLLLACLNPLFCQDSLSLLSLVSRTSQSSKQVLTDSTNRIQSSTKSKVLSSAIIRERTTPISLSAKKQTGLRNAQSGKKGDITLKGRKLFGEQKSVNSVKLRSKSKDTSALKPKFLPELDLSMPPISLEEDASMSDSRHVENVSLELIVAPSITQLQNDQYQSESYDYAPSDNVEATPARTCEDDNIVLKKGNASPPLSEQIREISNNLKSLLCSSIPLKIQVPEAEVFAPSSSLLANNDIIDPKTPAIEPRGYRSPMGGNFSNRSSRVKQALVQEYLNFLNSANKEELKSLKGIGEKRATSILKLREESPEPFKNLDDLQDIGLSAKQIKGMVKQVAGDLFN